MRNFRKTRKRGGVEFVKVYDCGFTAKKGQPKAPSTCITEFTKANNFLVVETKWDGNCFYESLSKFGERTGVPVLNRPHLALRNKLVDTLLENIHEVAPYVVNEEGNSVSEEEILDELETLRKPNVWNSNVGDIVIQYAAKAFGVNIIIYDVKEQFPQNIINQLTFKAPQQTSTTVDVLRVKDVHYKLLWPKDAGVLPKGKKIAVAKTVNKSRKNKKNNYNSNSSLSKNLKKIALMNSSFIVPK
jgi:hypothetical protein